MRHFAKHSFQFAVDNSLSLTCKNVKQNWNYNFNVLNISSYLLLKIFGTLTNIGHLVFIEILAIFHAQALCEISFTKISGKLSHWNSAVSITTITQTSSSVLVWFYRSRERWLP